MASTSIDFDVELVQRLFEDPDQLRQVLKLICQAVMAQEVAAHVGAAPHQRGPGRRGHRNGIKPRRLRTRLGELELDVPQVRGCEPYHPSLFARWQRSERALLVACGEMYFQGVSTRNVRRVLDAMCEGTSARRRSAASPKSWTRSSPPSARGGWTSTSTRT